MKQQSVMGGRVLAYAGAVSAGLIKGHDGKSYSFHRRDWPRPGEPEAGLIVTFTPAEGRQAAFNVKLVDEKYVSRNKTI